MPALRHDAIPSRIARLPVIFGQFVNLRRIGNPPAGSMHNPNRRIANPPQLANLPHKLLGWRALCLPALR
ncbi:MAG TPA: hypothetical protein VKJ01_19960, partial [Candidatus Solibacter sp.]|nr:hypothetical protein [Candidatus Solibacter sp.]